ncbi:MAG: VOC family protein [Dehalococcoidia bacterium]
MAEDWARPLVHFEIQARDADVMRDFYGTLFNWEIGPGPIMNIPHGIGGPEVGVGGHIMAGDHPGIVLHIQVLDLQASLAKAEELGGKVVMQSFQVPGGPTIARITDPEGNAVGLVQQ